LEVLLNIFVQPSVPIAEHESWVEFESLWVI